MSLGGDTEDWPSLNGLSIRSLDEVARQAARTGTAPCLLTDEA
jgi:hypothetical protein